MILVLLGTQNNNFSRLLEKIDECINEKIITDKVIVQAGYTKYNSKNMETIDFISNEEFERLIGESNLVITHGGVGSIVNSIKLGKKVIAVARLKRYKEHVNDHQIQIAEKFDKAGYIKGIINLDELPEAIKQINEFIPNKYISNRNNILNLITNFIDSN